MTRNQVLTNVRSVIRFTQYGTTKQITYNGAMIDATNALKYGYGIPATAMRPMGTRRESTFLPAGYSSISTL